MRRQLQKDKCANCVYFNEEKHVCEYWNNTQLTPRHNTKVTPQMVCNNFNIAKRENECSNK